MELKEKFTIENLFTLYNQLVEVHRNNVLDLNIILLTDKVSRMKDRWNTELKGLESGDKPDTNLWGKLEIEYKEIIAGLKKKGY